MALIGKQRMVWKSLLQAGTWALALIGSFVLPPPVWNLLEVKSWYHFTHFFVSALIGLLLIPMKVWSARQHTWLWWGIAVAIFIGSTISFLNYQHLRQVWTVRYTSQWRVVKGIQYSADAKAYIQHCIETQGYRPTDEELVMDYGGKSEEVWLREELEPRQLRIAYQYIATLTLFVLLLLTVVQAMACSHRRHEAQPPVTAREGLRR
jgi:hypothetical protein